MISGTHHRFAADPAASRTTRRRLAAADARRSKPGKGRDDPSNGSEPARLHYAWIIAGVTFVVLLITAVVRATPGVFMVPLETEFGWSRTVVSAAVAVNLALFGLIGAFAAALMDRWGLRRVILGALALLATAVALSTHMSSAWHLFGFWGVLVGAGTGVTSMVLAAVVATRWFEERRRRIVRAGRAVLRNDRARDLPDKGTRVCAGRLKPEACSL